MAPAATSLKSDSKKTYEVSDDMRIIFGKLDEAIDDIRNGRTLSSEEMWKEIDK